MGYMRHNAIVVTSWKSDLIEAAATRARNLGLTVEGPSAELMNGYRSMLICPDGSNEGWHESDEGDRRRAVMREWMREQRYDDGSNALEWVEVAFGGHDAEAVVEDHEWNYAAPL